MLLFSSQVTLVCHSDFFKFFKHRLQDARVAGFQFIVLALSVIPVQFTVVVPSVYIAPEIYNRSDIGADMDCNIQEINVSRGTQLCKLLWWQNSLNLIHPWRVRIRIKYRQLIFFGNMGVLKMILICFGHYWIKNSYKITQININPVKLCSEKYIALSPYI